MPLLSIIIPCHNEEKRLNSDEISSFLDSKKNASIIFINDGSTDNTLSLLKNLQKKHPSQIEILSNEKCEGKAESVRKGLLKSLLNPNIIYHGFIDADHAVSFDEFYRLFEILSATDKKFLFGSRIKKIGANIQRNEWRHFYSRIIATIIGFITKHKVYDTQCSAKIFQADIVPVVFNNNFKTKWLFDAEIVCRIFEYSKNLDKTGIEEPLLQWTEIKGSKLHWSNAFSILREIFILNKFYRAK